MIWLRLHWRDLLARAPLPMLALAASWGVYSFAALYVPEPVAIIQAAAFELTYIGLAVTRDMDARQRQRATAISVGAVIVSILYNSLDGLFHRNPAWLAGLPWYAEIAGAVLHGAPLAAVAYLVADLLLHSPSVQAAQQEVAPVKQIAQPSPESVKPAEPPVSTNGDAERTIVKWKDEEGLTYAEIGQRLGISRQAAQQKYTRARNP